MNCRGLIPLESIQIDPINVSTNRRSRHNLIGSKRAYVAKSTVQSGFDCTFQAYRLVREINVKDSDRSMEFIGFNIFKCPHGDEMRLKHYAGILLIEFWADLIYNGT